MQLPKTYSNRLIKPLICAASLSILAVPVNAASLSIQITNLTQGIHFTPFIVASHDDSTRLFKAGSAASTSLQMMAEGGQISGLEQDMLAAGGQVVTNPNEGLLAPGGSVSSFMLDSMDHDFLSLAAMLLPTNDAFAGLDSWKIPSEAGTYHILVNAYDAGTEANNELIVDGSGMPGMLGIPAAPGMNAGTGGTGLTMVESNTTVHIHRGSLGDDQIEGGKSDLDNTVHRWLNPVLKVTITVQ